MTTTRLTEALADLAEEAGTYATADGVVAAAGRRRRRRATALAAVAVLAVSVGSAAVWARDSAPDRVVSPEPGVWVSCAEQAPKPPPGNVRGMMDLPRLPADFVPASVVICRGEGRGTGPVVGNEYRGTDIAALVAALRLPDLPKTPGRDVACTLEAISWPWLALVDSAGHFVRPSPPRTPCGKPRAEVQEAITALKLTRVDSRVYDAHLAPEPAAARCEATWGDHVWIESRRAARPGPAGRPLAGAATVGLCEYHVSADERGRTFPTGDFARGRVLPQPRRDLIEAALSTTGPAEPCTGPASRFAVLMPQGGGYGEVQVELDGCRRVLSYPGRGKDPVVSQGGPELTRLLDES
ncbi:hypothetical protein ACTMTJ_27015 [Phytohabitans sp. LJ34]|uniref:hypothetical protein n=1 Tax=Phytohabitans sp. LJ34 TaxID=3452217 RepID=UPI003F8A2B79